VMMPGIDGFEVCRRLKQDARTREIPVIFITAENEAESVLTGFEVGGVDYIVPGRKVIFGQERLGLLRLVWIRM